MSAPAETKAIHIEQVAGLVEVWTYPPAQLMIQPIEGNPNAMGNAGLQRGDEGKGDETYTQAHTAALRGLDGVVAKIAGGAGTGHTFYPPGGPEDGIVHAMLPSVVENNWQKVIGRGVLGSPERLIEEIQGLRTMGYDTSADRILIDGAAFLAWDVYKEIDAAEELARGNEAIGTTKSGVGPAAADYTARNGMTFSELLLPDDKLRARVESEVQRHNRTLEALRAPKRFDATEVYQKFKKYAAELGPYIQNTFPVVMEALLYKNFIVECAQAFGLGRDTGHPGSVTSTDTGFGPLARRYRTSEKSLGRKIGVMKPIETAVGNHILYAPIGEDKQKLIYEQTAKRGRPEVGARSGRKRKVTWGSIPELRAAIETYGITEIALKKVDIADVLPEIEIGTHYVFADGTRTDKYDPEDPRMQDPNTRMDTIVIPGWLEDTSHLTSFEDAPTNLKRYVAVLEYLLGVPVISVGVGPHYEEKVLREGYPFTQ